MYDEARLLNASGGGDPVPKGQCLAIGDRLDTDIEARQPRRLRFARRAHRRDQSTRAHARPRPPAPHLRGPRPARPAGARPPLEERYPGLAALSACDDEGKAKVLRDVLDGLRRELDKEQA